MKRDGQDPAEESLLAHQRANGNHRCRAGDGAEALEVPAGSHLIRSVLATPLLEHLVECVAETFLVLEAAQRSGDTAAIHGKIPPGERFVPTASSVTIGAVLGEEAFGRVLTSIAARPAGEFLRAELGSELACDLDQCWVRRQFAPARYPRWHAPHGWHQDGALGFDFLAHPDGNFPAAAVLKMVTCWIALTPCGIAAPGLELVPRRLDGLLAPAELTDERVRTRFLPEEFWRPVLEPGDALLFCGDILHRTHVTPAMTKDRTSIELRFFPADNLPPRLQGDRFLLLG